MNPSTRRVNDLDAAVRAEGSGVVGRPRRSRRLGPPRPSREDEHAAHNYHPLPVVVASGEGAWVTDVDGRRYLDCLAAYSAVNFGHGNPRLVAAAREQLDRITLTSRAFHNDRLGPFVTELAALCGKDMVLPMNTGAEAVESGIKVARAWGYRVKGVAPDAANIIVMAGNFHGRTTTIVSFSDDPDAHDDFGPVHARVPHGAVRRRRRGRGRHRRRTPSPCSSSRSRASRASSCRRPTSCRRCASSTRDRNVLLIADEIQSGLGRVGATFACELVGVVPDLYLLGKALGGGIVPVSRSSATATCSACSDPGEHGSTFGGNPLAAAVGLEVVRMLATGEPQERARALGAHLHDRLESLVGHGVVTVRGAGLWAGIDIDPAIATGREVCEALMRRGVLAKDTHGSTIRLAPPIVVEEADLDWAVDQLAAVLDELRGERPAQSSSTVIAPFEVCRSSVNRPSESLGTPTSVRPFEVSVVTR